MSATDLMFPATEPMRTSEVAGVQMNLDVVATSDAAAIEVRRVYALSNDLLTWDTPVALGDGGYVSALGVDYAATGTVVPVTKQYIRFGVQSNQKAGSGLEEMRVTCTTLAAKR